LGEQIKLYSEQQTLAEVYDEAISNVLYIGFENRLDIEKDILVPLEKNSLSLEGIGQILRPLMKPKLSNHFNVVKAYGAQKIESEIENLKDETYYLEKGDDELSKAVAERTKYVQEEYKNIIKNILETLCQGADKSVKLSEIYTETQNIELLRNVLVQLHSDRLLNIEVIRNEGMDHIYDPGEDFDFAYSYAKAIQENNDIKTIKYLLCETDTHATIIIQGIIDKKYLKCHDLIFTAKTE
jgi:hypothetical protein